MTSHSAVEELFFARAKKRGPKRRFSTAGWLVNTPCLRARRATRAGSTPPAGFFDETQLRCSWGRGSRLTAPARSPGRSSASPVSAEPMHVAPAGSCPSAPSLRKGIRKSEAKAEAKAEANAEAKAEAKTKAKAKAKAESTATAAMTGARTGRAPGGFGMRGKRNARQAQSRRTASAIASSRGRSRISTSRCLMCSSPSCSNRRSTRLTVSGAWRR